MRLMKKFIAGIFFSLIGLSCWSQQEAMYSQYMFNGLFLNPAYAGSHDYFSSTAIFRNQWVSFPGAPKSATLAIDGPLYGNPMGIGMIAGFDQIGVTKRTDFFLNYSYKIRMHKGYLAFGVKAGVSQYNANLSELTIWDQPDEVFISDINGKLIPTMGFGAYYYQENWYAGISSPTLLGYESDKKFNLDVEKSSALKRHYFATAGCVLPVSSAVKLKPSFLVKYLPGAPVQADINCAAMFNEVFWLGASYRTGDAVAGLIEYQANKKFRVGYAYDFTFSSIRHYSAGTHELMLGYDFGKDFTKVKTPRFF